MKIALTLPRLPLSGVGTSVAIIENGLTQAGHRVDVLITGPKPGDDFKFATQSGWNLLHPVSGMNFLPQRLKRLAQVIALNKYSVVINNTSPETQMILPCLKPEIKRIGVMRVLNPNALRHLAMNSEYMHTAVAISAEMERIMSADNRIKAPIRLISNCTRVKGEGTPRLGDRLRLCYVGRLTNPDKNVKIIPAIAKYLQDKGLPFSLDIAGDGPLGQWLENEFKRVSVHDVKLHGLISREETLGIMSHSNFVLLPSFSEGLSNVMLEGMALGCVPVCSDIHNFKWVLGKVADQLQCSINDPLAYGQQILHLATHPDTYQEIQHYLKERQQRLFTPEHTVKGYLDLIAELMSGKGRKLPDPCDFRKLKIPREYRLYCSSGWRFIQKAKNMLVKL